jgi:oxaloacetate decarboxylase gamma subunit
METNSGTALMLMVTGMLTVFTILFLVVLCSKIMIMIINRFFQELVDLEPAPHLLGGQTLDPKKVSVIISAVEAVTAGKGKIQEIKKIDEK